MLKYLLCAALLLHGVTAANAQQYPTRPITLLCWSAAGSPVDVFARVLAKLLTPELGQNVVVDNRTGGSGIVMVNALIKAPADGYTIGANTLSLAALFSEPNVAFKPDDLQMITRSQIDPYSLVVHTSTPFRSLEEFVRLARNKPGFMNIAGPFAMSSHRVAWEAFAAAANIKLTWVAYPGGGPALIAIAGGHVDATATNPGNVKPYIAANKLRVLAVSSEKRLTDFPDVPTYKERGYDIVRYQWRGVMARAGTPKPVVERLAAAIQKVQQSTEWKDYLRNASQLDGFQGPEVFRDQLMKDKQEVEALKKKLGI